jgi:hypothetical protein
VRGVSINGGDVTPEVWNIKKDGVANRRGENVQEIPAAIAALNKPKPAAECRPVMVVSLAVLPREGGFPGSRIEEGLRESVSVGTEGNAAGV